MPVSSWEDFRIESEARAKGLSEFEAALGGLGAWFGAWLQMMRAMLPEWEVLRAWDGGLWGRLFDALEEFADVS
ncbi:hypothetical protein B0H14DRAFT_3434410 [Mycena olivaceomarginata]|nr:hypothetical protein B0H14DRAFT_3434410 [Mycena olivaceomarginata]